MYFAPQRDNAFLTLADAREKLEDWRKLLQRGSTAWGNRQQAPGFPHDSRRRIQPAGVTKAGKLYLPAVQQSGADRPNHELTFALDQSLGADQWHWSVPHG